MRGTRGMHEAPRLAVAAWVCAAFVVLAGLPVATCGDEAPSAKELLSRRSSLRSAAGRYITHRKRFPSRCPGCRGSGKRVTRKGRSLVQVDCKQCLAQGSWLSREDYRKVYYEMRTPAFRALPGIKDTLGAQYDQARRGRPWPLRIDRYRLKDWELVDATHGIVWFQYNASKVPTATYWIYAPDEAGGKPEWCVYDARADGPWPSGAEATAPVGGEAAPREDTWQALTAEHGLALRTAVAWAQITFRVMEAEERGSVLRIRLDPGADAQGRPPPARIAADAVLLSRMILSIDAPWERVEATWRDTWRDAFGREVLRPRWVSALGRAEQAAAAWANLTVAEQAKQIALAEVTHDGWKPLHPGVAPSTEPPAEIPTTPEAPPPEDPEPTAPQAGPPPPMPPAAPPSSAPTAPDLPELTASAKRAAEKALARMNDLLRAASAAFDDGVLAHRNGAMDLWQEKLSEARGHLGEVEDTWYGEMVPAMPGADEAIQDAVANEHYGEIWDTIGKLRSMVRKLSRGS